MKWDPYSYQVDAWEFMTSRDTGALFLDPGLGKTSITLAAIKHWIQNKEVQSVLIVAPLRVIYEVWPEERDKWDQFHGLTIKNLHKTKPKDRGLQKAHILLINPEGLVNYLKLFNGSQKPFDAIVIDESSKFKSYKSSRFKQLKTVLASMRKRWILTGTPCPNTAEDLWSQIFIIDLGRRLGPTISAYRENFGTEKIRYFGTQAVRIYEYKPKALKRIEKSVAQVALNMAQEDYLTLPPKIVNVINITFPPMIQKIYDEMEKRMATEIDGQTMLAMSVGESVGKLQQITGGFFYDYETEDGIERLHKLKIEALKELTDSLSNSTLLVCVAFRAEVEMIREEYGYDIPYLGGGLKPDQARVIIGKWNEGKIPILLAHPQSMGHGLNLQAGGHHLCWYGLTWSLEDYEQTIARIHRQGQEKPTYIYHIVVRKTIDEVIRKRLRTKFGKQESVRNAVEKFIESLKGKQYETRNKNRDAATVSPTS